MNSTALEPKFSRVHIIIFICAAAVFLLAAVFGALSGISYGKSEATYAQARDIATALKFFNADQGQYPTATQFSSQMILSPIYMSTMPQPEDVSGSCSKYPQFAYDLNSTYGYVLQFCLLQGVGGAQAGVNYLTAN